MAVTVKVDVSKAVEGIGELKSQLPYGLARSLTKTAADSRDTLQASLAQRFTLRNRFFQGGIRIKPADKKSQTRIEADVHTFTENKTTGAPGFAERQEDGGEKVPVNGRAHLAIPTRYLREMAPGVIPAELRPRNLLSITALGKYTPRRSRRLGPGNVVNAKIVRGFVFFVQTLKDGRSAIMGRHMHDRDAYPFYLLIPSASIKPRLNMKESVFKTVASRFGEHWAESWQAIVAGWRR